MATNNERLISSMLGIAANIGAGYMKAKNNNEAYTFNH